MTRCSDAAPPRPAHTAAHTTAHTTVHPTAWKTPEPGRRLAIGWMAAIPLAAALPGAARAQVARPFPANALRGEIRFGQPPEVELNGQPARLAPGARIRGTDNMIAMSAALVGQGGTVHYTIEPSSGLLFEVWILRREEIARRPWPSTPAEAERWAFDPAAQTWTRR